MNKQIIVGTRASRLAMTQTEMAVEQIKKANSDVDVVVSRISTVGDRDHRTPLWQASTVGVFVKELEEALLDRRIDLAVHSLKDMPSIAPAGLEIIAVLERAYPGDVLITKGKKLAELPSGAVIGTGSPRRAAELKSLRPDLKTVSIRGNVDTRVNKALTGEVDGVILAAAGLKRLGWEKQITEYLPLDRFLPAGGQGIIAIEARSDDKETARIVAPLNHQPTWYSMIAERAFLRTLAGGCQAPLAALALVVQDTLKIEGMVMDVEEHKTLRFAETGSPSQADELGTKLAKRLLAAGADKLLAADGEDENG